MRERALRAARARLPRRREHADRHAPGARLRACWRPRASRARPESFARAEAAARPALSRHRVAGGSTEADGPSALRPAHPRAARGRGHRRRDALVRACSGACAPSDAAPVVGGAARRSRGARALRDAGLRRVVVSNSDGTVEQGLVDTGLGRSSTPSSTRRSSASRSPTRRSSSMRSRSRASRRRGALHVGISMPSTSWGRPRGHARVAPRPLRRLAGRRLRGRSASRGDRRPHCERTRDGRSHGAALDGGGRVLRDLVRGRLRARGVASLVAPLDDVRVGGGRDARDDLGGRVRRRASGVRGKAFVAVGDDVRAAAAALAGAGPPPAASRPTAARSPGSSTFAGGDAPARGPGSLSASLADAGRTCPRRGARHRARSGSATASRIAWRASAPSSTSGHAPRGGALLALLPVARRRRRDRGDRRPRAPRPRTAHRARVAARARRRDALVESTGILRRRVVPDGPGRLRVRAASPTAFVVATATCDPATLAGYVYRDPSGFDLYVAQSDVATCEVAWCERRHRLARWNEPRHARGARAAIEFHERTPLPGVGYVPWDATTAEGGEPCRPAM